MHIVQFGTFDVANYGDLLFPLIAAHRLRDLATKFTLLSPLGGTVLRWEDAPQSFAVDVAFEEGFSCDACLVGGGDIIRVDTTALKDYAQDGLTNRLAYPSLWLGAALVAQAAQARLIWNAPGVPHPFTDPRLRALAGAAVAANDYTTVRDPVSRAYIGGEVAVPVVPDTAIDIFRLWPRPTLRPVLYDLFAAHGRPVAERTAVIHVNSSSKGRMDEVAASVTHMAAASECLPILLAIGLCHGDDAWVMELSAKLTIPHLAVDKPKSLREIAACLAYADYYVGSSLYGFITAFAYGRKGLIVGYPAAHKLNAVPAQLGIPEASCQSWQEAEDRLATVLHTPESNWSSALARARAALDEHWARIATVLREPLSEDGQARKDEFGRQMTIFNQQNGGLAARLSGILGIEAAQRRLPPGNHLFDIDPIIIQGQASHAVREGNRFILHPPAKGTTELCFGRLMLTGGTRIHGSVTIGHPRGNPVRFTLLLVDIDAQILATGDVVAEAGRETPWSLVVPDGVTTSCNLFISTQMARPQDPHHYAWATLIDPLVESPQAPITPSEITQSTQVGLAKTAGGLTQEMPGTVASVENNASITAQASSDITR